MTFGSCDGTVNLPNVGRAKTGSYPLALRSDAQFGKLTVPACAVLLGNTYRATMGDKR